MDSWAFSSNLLKFLWIYFQKNRKINWILHYKNSPLFWSKNEKHFPKQNKTKKGSLSFGICWKWLKATWKQIASCKFAIHQVSLWFCTQIPLLFILKHDRKTGLLLFWRKTTKAFIGYFMLQLLSLGTGKKTISPIRFQLGL